MKRVASGEWRVARKDKTGDSSLAARRSPLATLYPFAGHFLEIGGFRLHYLDEGAGDPVVMLHGNPTWSFYYRNLASALRDAYRVVVPDHIGCGLSDKPDAGGYPYTLERRVQDLDELLERIGVRENITLVLHDWGGMIGMAWRTAGRNGSSAWWCSTRGRSSCRRASDCRGR